MEFFILYLWMISGNIAFLLFVIGVILGLIVLCCGSSFWCEWKEEWPTWLKRCLTWAIICLVVCTLIPSKKDIALIIAGGTVYNVVTSDTAKQIGGKGVELLNKKLDEYLKEDVPAAK